jgi:hypothetical protein
MITDLSARALLAARPERTRIVIFRLEPAFSGMPDEQLALDRQKTHSMKIIGGLGKNRCVDFEGL